MCSNTKSVHTDPNFMRFFTMYTFIHLISNPFKAFQATVTSIHQLPSLYPSTQPNTHPHTDASIHPVTHAPIHPCSFLHVYSRHICIIWINFKKKSNVLRDKTWWWSVKYTCTGKKSLLVSDTALPCQPRPCTESSSEECHASAQLFPLRHLARLWHSPQPCLFHIPRTEKSLKMSMTNLLPVTLSTLNLKHLVYISQTILLLVAKVIVS